MKTKIIENIKYKFWELMSLRCNHCPFAGSDWSDYHDTGYIGPKCELHPKNECEGCLTPAIVIFFKYCQYKRQEEKACEYEAQMLQWEQEHQDEINQIISDGEDDWYRQTFGE